MAGLQRFGRTLVPASLLISLVFAGFAPAAEAQRPVVERLQPASGPPGTQVNIVGRNVGRGARFFLGDVELPVVRALPYRTTVSIPAGALTGDVIIQTSSGRYLGPRFRVTDARPAAQITALEPAAGPPGSEVTLVGANFSPRLADNVVSFGGRPVVVRTATTSELRVIVPSGATSDVFSVQVSGVPGVASSPRFEVTTGTGITALEPTVGAPGGTLTIRGTGFAAGNRGNRVYLGSQRLRVRSASETEIVVSLPRRPSSGELLVDVRGGGRTTYPTPYEVRNGPEIRNFQPQAGPPGTTVTIRGRHFGTDIRAVQVSVAGQLARVRRVLPDEIEVDLPTNVATGPLEVRVAGMVASGGGTFSVTGSLGIASVEPRRAAPETVVTINGAGFSHITTQNIVTFGGVAAQVVSATPTQLQVRVPVAPSGNVRVQVGSAIAASPYPFVVGAGPQVTQLSPASGPAGTQVTIFGSNFGRRRRLVTVELNGQRVRVRSVQDDQIQVEIPRGARSGQFHITIGTNGSTVSPLYSVEAIRAVSQVTPRTGFPGTEVIVRGQGFPRDGVTLSFAGSNPVAVRRVGPAEIRATVPDGAQTGPVTIYLPGGRTMDGGQFSVTPVPEGTAITRIEPECAYTGCTVVLRGYGFAGRRAHNRVRFNGRPVRVRESTPTSLRVTLPNAPGNGRFEVDVRRGGEAQSPAFVILSR